MKKLLEITKPSQCIYRVSAIIAKNIASDINHVEGYGCGHPNCTKKFLKSINKDFLPCNKENDFPKHCLLGNCKSTAPSITMSDEVAEKISNTMDIYSKRGTAVRLQMKDGEIFGGYDSDKEHAHKFLKFGAVYHIKRTEVGDWHTDVYLKEVPDQRFNSVMFEHVKE